MTRRRPLRLLNVYDVVVVARREHALGEQRVLQPDKLADGGDPYLHSVGDFYVRHTHTCPGCRCEASHESDPSEDGEPRHCQACREEELCGKPDASNCEACFSRATKAARARRRI